MNLFSGFSDKDESFIPIPGSFFSELLPEIMDIGELKLTLYIFWRLEKTEGPYYYILKEELKNDKHFMQGLGKTQREALINLEDALEKAVQRGTLLEIQTKSHNQPDIMESLYFLNTPRGQAALDGLASGNWELPDKNIDLVQLANERPNIFQLYETHFGPLTPMIAEALRDAESKFPEDWIKDAIRISVKNNVRRWRYVEAILEKWEQEGRDERKDKPDSAEARERYFEELAKRLGR